MTWTDSEFKPTSNSQFHVFSTILWLPHKNNFICASRSRKYFHTKIRSLIAAPFWDSFEGPYEGALSLTNYKQEGWRQMRRRSTTKQNKATNPSTVLRRIIDYVKKKMVPNLLTSYLRKPRIGWGGSFSPSQSCEPSSCWVWVILIDWWTNDLATLSLNTTKGMVFPTYFRKILHVTISIPTLYGVS